MQTIVLGNTAFDSALFAK